MPRRCGSIAVQITPREVAVKISFEIIIDAKRADVWKIFDDAENLKRWQPALQTYTHISGDPAQSGAITELRYNENGREVLLTETILDRRPPDFLSGTYDSKWAHAVIVNHFNAIDDDTTQWTSYCNFRFKGFMKLLSIFVASSIRKRTNADMQRFKLLVETEVASA